MKVCFVLGAKQSLLINDECSSWYDKARDLLMLVWNMRKEILYGNAPVGEVNRNNPTPECEVNDTACYDS